MKNEVNIPAGWSEFKSEGDWTKEDGRHFCWHCSKMLRVGDRVFIHTTHPHRGGRGESHYRHVNRCELG